MITLEEIKNELKDIRFYYSKKTMFDAAFKETKGNNITDLVDKYNETMKNAPTKLYGIYVCLYVHGGTQESIANEMSYTPFYIYKLNNKLIEFLYKVFNEGWNFKEFFFARILFLVVQCCSKVNFYPKSLEIELKCLEIR